MRKTSNATGPSAPQEAARPKSSSSPWKPRSTLQSTVGKLLLALTATALTLAACEWIVRLRYPEYGIPVFTTKLFTEYDPLLGWRKIPNFHGAHVQEEYTIVERFNSKGLRGPEYSYEKPEDEYRIIVLGDSFTKGYTVEFKDLFTELLKQNLNAELETSIEVINTGTGGYSTDQELLFFRTEGKKYEPDLVILLYCDNDTEMNTKANYKYWKRGEKPLFELVDGTLSLKSTPNKTWDRQEEAEKDRAQHEHDYKERFVLWKPETWYLYRLVRHVMSHRSNGIIPAEGPIEPDTNDMSEGRAWTDTGYRGDKSDWIMTEALMARIKKETSDIGAEFLLFNIPNKKDIHGSNPPNYATENNLRVLSHRRDIAFIPTVDTFRKQASLLAPSGRRLYWKKDTHWTAEGHRLTAQILTQHLLFHNHDWR
jgi:hypothetical protein